MSKPTAETLCINSTLQEYECEAINYDSPHKPRGRTGRKPVEKGAHRPKGQRKQKRKS